MHLNETKKPPQNELERQELFIVNLILNVYKALELYSHYSKYKILYYFH